MVRTAFAALTLCAAGVALTGCGGSSTPTAAPAAPASSTSSTSPTSSSKPSSTSTPTSRAGAVALEKPCGLNTPAVVSAAVSKAATATDEGYQCKWMVSSSAWLTTKALDMSLTNTKQILSEAKRLPGVTTVSGLGDEAYQASGGLYVRAGDVLVMVQTDRLSTPMTREGLQSVAKEMLAHLG